MMPAMRLTRGVLCSFSQIDDRHFVAADDFRHINLQEVEIEPSLANCLTERLRIGRVTLHLGEIGAMWATNPM